jgi:hypothetical protein
LAIVLTNPGAYYRPVGSIAKSAVGVVTKVFGYVLYPLKKGVRAIRK